MGRPDEVVEAVSNPRGLSDDAVRRLLKEDQCPACIVGELDTGYECNSCNYDAHPLVKRLMATLTLRA